MRTNWLPCQSHPRHSLWQCGHSAAANMLLSGPSSMPAACLQHALLCCSHHTRRQKVSDSPMQLHGRLVNCCLLVQAASTSGSLCATQVLLQQTAIPEPGKTCISHLSH